MCSVGSEDGRHVHWKMGDGVINSCNQMGDIVILSKSLGLFCKRHCYLVEIIKMIILTLQVVVCHYQVGKLLDNIGISPCNNTKRCRHYRVLQHQYQFNTPVECLKNNRHCLFFN